MAFTHRIKTLDGFRFIAIVSVLLYHFYSRWTPPLFSQNYYPYGDRYANWFRYGYLGVPFFFIISGFVIFYTLEKTPGFGSFLLKRLIRLFPPILLASLISYSAITIFDPTHQLPAYHSGLLNFLPSLTFTHPNLWQLALHNNNINYIDSSYWSLWPEIIFYVWAGVLYYFNKANFVRNWFITNLFLFIIVRGSIFLLYHPIGPHHWNAAIAPILNRFEWIEYIFFRNASYNLYFSLGIIFYCLFRSRRLPFLYYLYLLIPAAYQFKLFTLPEITGTLIMIALFLLFIYKDKYLGFLRVRFITTIGMVSYFLYLIHNNAGMLLITKWAHYFPGSGFIISIVVIAGLMLFSFITFKLYERPLSSFLRRHFFI